MIPEAGRCLSGNRKAFQTRGGGAETEQSIFVTSRSSEGSGVVDRLWTMALI